jgi:hypothetical protein
MTQLQAREWRRHGFGGPPEPWAHDAQRDLDRLATSYYVDVLDLHRRLAGVDVAPDVRARFDDLLTTATRHKHEIDYTLRHWATPVERARVEDRLGTLMRISRQMRAVVEPDDDRPRRRTRPLPAPDAA